MSLERLICASFDADTLEMSSKRMVRLWEKKREQRRDKSKENQVQKYCLPGVEVNASWPQEQCAFVTFNLLSGIVLRVL